MAYFSIQYKHQYLPLPVYEVPAIGVNTTKSTYTFTSVLVCPFKHFTCQEHILLVVCIKIGSNRKLGLIWVQSDTLAFFFSLKKLPWILTIENDNTMKINPPWKFFYIPCMHKVCPIVRVRFSK